MPNYCRPLFLSEVADLLWPGEYTDCPRTGARRALRFLRRIERDRDCQLLFKETKRYHTTTGALKKHCRHLLDDPDRIQREIDQRFQRSQLRLVKVEAGLKAVVKRTSIELLETAKVIGEILKDVKALADQQPTRKK